VVNKRGDAMKSIKIFSTKTCAFCHAEKEYLKSKSIAYQEILVDEDPSQVSVLLEKSGTMGVPFTIITDENGDEESFLGFDKKKLDAILSIG
jgi:glutaredoxin 3